MNLFRALMCSAALAIGLAAPALADAQQSELEKAVLADEKLMAYLEVNETPKFESVLTYVADVNGDKILDDVYIGHLGKQSFVAIGLIDKDGGVTYAGYSPIDSSSAPKVSVKDFTGDGKSEIHVISERGEEKRMVTLVGCVDGKTKRIFRETLSTKSVEALAHNKVTKFINFVDTDKDGIKEITVSARQTELVGKAEKEREISGSSVTANTTYVLNDGVYAVSSHVAETLSSDAQLSIATVLAKEGESLRARAILGDLLKSSGLDDQVAVAGMALLSTLDDTFVGHGKVIADGKPVKS